VGVAFIPLLLVSLLLSLTGCVTQPQSPAPVASLMEIRQQNVVIQKWDFSCGAASLATILKYQHHDHVTERMVAEGMLRRTDPLKVKVRGGFSLLDLKRYVESRGLKGKGYLDLDLNGLIEIAPAIVPVDLGDYNHFVVFRGILDGKALLSDPAFGNRTVDINIFEKSWVNKIGFIVTRTDGKNPPNQLIVLPSDSIAAPSIAVRQIIR